jgi:hypothetical protein
MMNTELLMSSAERRSKRIAHEDEEENQNPTNVGPGITDAY